MIPFAYEDKGNHPEMSHSFITRDSSVCHGKNNQLTPELPTANTSDWEFEAFTIRLAAGRFSGDPICAFLTARAARLFASKNQCPVSKGNTSISKDTLKLAAEREERGSRCGDPMKSQSRGSISG